MLRILLALAMNFALVSAALGQAPKIPVLLDADLGSDIDDAFALGLVAASPELELRGVTTVSGDTETRAWMACRFLSHVGKREIPVAVGAEPQAKQEIGGQFQYHYHPAVLFNRTSRPVKESAVEFLYRKLKDDPGNITIIAVGPLTNVARLLDEHPDSKKLIRKIVSMGGSFRIGYDGKPKAEIEWNIRLDPKAARTVYESGVPLVIAPLDGSGTIRLERGLRKKLFDRSTLLTLQLQALYQMWDQETPVLFDPAAVALAISEDRFTMEDLHVLVDDKGMTTEGKGKPNARVAVGVKAKEFAEWFVDRVGSFGDRAYPPAAGNLVEPAKKSTKMPNRVHAFEDFETNIEKKWWLAGKLETKNVPPGSKRALQGILTQDFDDRQGVMATMYTAVVFNPVPGPPMGKNTRLRFRCWVKGSPIVRCQLYSLTNGYHRYLTIKDVPQETWTDYTVDMTHMRRPDGSGGPLSENERIDDIQFYVPPDAELKIDDILLYDEAAEGEQRPFPKRVHFTGLFDTGKQGKEWPGSFDIVDKKPLPWRAAQSVKHPKTGLPWLEIGLRGPRPMAAKTHLAFRYRLQEGDSFDVALTNTKTGAEYAAPLRNLQRGEWASRTIDFNAVAGGGPKVGESIDAIRFVAPARAMLQIDDLLLYEPGE
jgi:purine nucleosidase